MSGRGLLLFSICLALLARAQAVDLSARSVSSSKQFIVYCSDVALRGRVSSFAEEVKSQLLALLGEGDGWKSPIVITLEPTTDPAAKPVTLQPFETPDGCTIQIGVRIGEDPAAVNLQKHIVRALLLEISYRDRGVLKGGQHYEEAPWWIVEGALQIFRQRDRGVNVDLYKGLLAAEKLPALEQLLHLNPESLGATAQALDAAYAMCLLQLLIEQPTGRPNLARLVRHWPDCYLDPVAAIATDFPSLGSSPMALQKWWTVNVARFADADRYKGLSAADTDKALAALLQFELVINRKGDKKLFQLNQYEEFIKLPGAKAEMSRAQSGVVALSARANALFHPIVTRYEQIFGALARGKTAGIGRRLADLDQRRVGLVAQIDAIADYLNWYEATQFGVRSGAFKGFLQAANELSVDDLKTRKDDPVAKYLDLLQQEF